MIKIAVDSQHCERMVQQVEQRIENNLSALLRHLSQEVDLSLGACHKIGRKQL